MREFIITVGVMFGAVAMGMAVLAGIAIAILYPTEVYACKNLNKLTGVETNVTVSLGCMVKYRGEWVAREVMTQHKQDVTVK